MKTKLLALILMIAMITVMAGCGKRNNNSEKKINFDEETAITILTKDSHTELLYIKRIISLYEEQTGNKIKIISIKGDEFEKKASAMYAEATAPDVLIHFNDADLARFNVAENFYYMNNEAWVDELTDSARAYTLDSKGNMLGLPFWENSVSGCYYNKTLLEELGLRPASTQAEFDMLCKALKSVGYTPMYWGGKDCNWMFQFGLDPIFAESPDLLEKLNKNEIKYADIPAVRDMIKWFDDAAKKGWFNSDYANAAWGDIPSAMGKGSSATLFAWDTWFSMNMKEDEKYSEKDFALMPVFMNTVENGTYEGGNMGMFMANKKSKKLKVVLEFLSFCAKPENYNIAFDGIPTVKCFKNQTTNIQSEMVTNAMASIEENIHVSTAWPKIIGYRQEDVGAAVLKMFEGKTDVEGCIKLMDEYRIKAAKELGAAGF